MKEPSLDRAALFKALSDPTRLRIHDLLADRELSVAELAEALGAEPNGLHYHINHLVHAGLITVREVRRVRGGIVERVYCRAALHGDHTTQSIQEELDLLEAAVEAMRLVLIDLLLRQAEEGKRDSLRFDWGSEQVFLTNQSRLELRERLIRLLEELASPPSASDARRFQVFYAGYPIEGHSHGT